MTWIDIAISTANAVMWDAPNGCCHGLTGDQFGNLVMWIEPNFADGNPHLMFVADAMTMLSGQMVLDVVKFNVIATRRAKWPAHGRPPGPAQGYPLGWDSITLETLPQYQPPHEV